MTSFQGNFLSYVSSNVYPVLDGILSNLGTTDAASALVALHAVDALDHSRYINPIVDIEKRNQRLKEMVGDPVGILLLGANVPEYMERMVHPIRYWQKHENSKDPAPTVWLAVIIGEPPLMRSPATVRFVKTLPSGEMTFTDISEYELRKAARILYPHTENSTLHEQVPYVDLMNDPLKVRYTVREYKSARFALTVIDDDWCTARLHIH